MNTSTAKQPGKIMLVGIGPGSIEHMTARARSAIAEADAVIGYSTYIKLVADLLDGKEVVKKGMTEELDRAVDALERARAGKKVALISSGDVGVYGMAGPTYEVLFQAGWTPDCGIEVEIVPGASALNSCAALVGAPLTHDFCAISLSDLLTPWPTIARRLDAAASADFVTALYNPKSGRRTRQIVEAQRLFLRHRRPDTPVAIVKSSYRPKQRIEFTTLDKMSEADIGMLSTVLIGNSNTFVRDGLMVTPRGYANKYDVESGDAKNGERAGRSLSTGLTGWLETLHASNESPAQQAARYGLPLDYIVELLAEPLEPEEAGDPSADENA
jgi:precorrin-3B C17-methyltransferase